MSEGGVAEGGGERGGYGDEEEGGGYCTRGEDGGDGGRRGGGEEEVDVADERGEEGLDCVEEDGEFEFFGGGGGTVGRGGETFLEVAPCYAACLLVFAIGRWRRGLGEVTRNRRRRRRL